MQDAAGNTVTPTTPRSSPSPRRPAPAPSPAAATPRPRRDRDQDDHRCARRLGDDGGHLGRADDRTLGAFTVVHGAAADIALTGSTPTSPRRDPRLTATIQDAAGNTVTSDNTHRRRLLQGSGTGSVSGSGNATAASGVATKTITGVLAGSVTMEATAGGLTTGTLGAFTIVHGAAAQIALAGSTANLTSGATRVLTATIQDAAGNTVTSDNSTVVAFAQASGAGSVTGTGNDTGASGVATKTITGALGGHGEHASDLGRPHHRHPRRLHRRPRRRQPRSR